MKRNIRFAGAGGQGVILSSVLLAKAYALGADYNVSQTQSYGPEARGGACKAELIVSDNEIGFIKFDNADIFVAFNQVGYDKYYTNVKEDAYYLINSTLVESDKENCYEVPATKIAEEMGMSRSINIVMLGALTRLLDDLSYDLVEDEIIDSFDVKFKQFNVEAFERGYDYMDDYLELTEEEMKEKYIDLSYQSSTLGKFENDM